MTYRIHPLANILPMLPDEELAALATSIAATGLRHPILLAEVPDPETGELVEMVVDGRNRLAACGLAGIAPRYERSNGEDIGALILAENIERRNLNAGQRAMARAMPSPATPGKRSEARANLPEVSARSVTMARFVLSNDPTLAGAVMAGTESLNAAYETARVRVAAAKVDEAARRGESKTPRYDAMLSAIAACDQAEVFKDMDLATALQIARNRDPERLVGEVRLRAGRGVDRLLRELAGIEKRP